MFQVETHGQVSVLRFAHGKASALDLELCTALEERLTEFARGDSRALVLTGTGSIFSAGVDLVRLLDGGAEYVHEFLPALDEALARLYFLERPVVAAINGHAIAGGAILALGCDLRIMTKGRASFGVPELEVGVPFPQLGIEMLRATVPPQHLDEVATLGTLFGPDACLAKGLVHELQEPDAVLPRAIALATKLAAVPQKTMALHKRLLRAPVHERMSREGSAWLAETLAVWTAEDTLSAVRDYVRKTLRK